MKYCCQTWALDSSSFWVQISLLGPVQQIRWHQVSQGGVCPWLVFVPFLCVCVSLHLSHPLFIMCRFRFVCTSCLSQTGWKGWKIADFPEEQTVPAGPIKAICSVRPCLSAPPSLGKNPPPLSRATGLQLLTKDLWHVSPKCLAPMAPHRLAPRCANSLPLPATFRSITVRYQWGPSWGSRQKWHFQSASTYYPSSASGLVKLDLWLGCQHK